jgi:hypothetical protein
MTVLVRFSFGHLGMLVTHPLRAHWLALLLCGLAGSVRAQEASPDGENLFVRQGLIRLGERWLLPQEIELREKLAELPRRRERIVSAEKELEAAVQGNLRLWQESRPAMAVLEQSLARLATGDPQRVLLERQIAGLKSAAIDPDHLSGKPDVRTQLIDLSQERCELLSAVAWIRQTPPALQRDYARLAAQPEIAAALQSERKQQLGPQRSYQRDLSRLLEYEQLAATRWVPIFQQSGQTRLTALVDERAPATFTWSQASDQPVVLTASAAEAAGLAPPQGAPLETIVAAPQRTVAARRITIGKLRLGGCVLKDTIAYVLPPEAEDVGNRLGRLALIDHRVRLAPQQLRMWIDADP